MRLPSQLRRGRTPAGPPVPFIVGVTRSGTTLLRLMLDAHPDLAIPPETHFVPSLIKATRKRGVTCEEAHAIVTGHRQWGDFNLDSADLLERYCALDRIDLRRSRVRSMLVDVGVLDDRRVRRGVARGGRTPDAGRAARERKDERETPGTARLTNRRSTHAPDDHCPMLTPSTYPTKNGPIFSMNSLV